MRSFVVSDLLPVYAALKHLNPGMVIGINLHPDPAIYLTSFTNG